MKLVRNILIFFVIIFGFDMQAEIYQNELWNFEAAYYVVSNYTNYNDDMESFLADAEEVAQKHNVHVFTTFCTRVSEYQNTLYIYGDDEVIRDSLKSTMDLEEKTYTALINGITTVEFTDFSDAADTSGEYELMFSYIGDEEDIFAVYQELSESYSLTEPEYWQSTENDMMIIVWGLVAILMIILNVIEVVRRKKEVVVRASLGESAAAIALRSAITDIITYAALFILAKLLISQFIAGNYAKYLVLAIYCTGSLLSVIPYIAFVRFDVRKAFANASNKKGLFYLLNGLKVLATAMTILTITTNLNSINGSLFTSSTILEDHYDDLYFNVMSYGYSPGDDGESAQISFWNDLYDNEYDTINPVICIGAQIGDNGNYVFVNNNARDMLQGFSDMLTEDDEAADIVVFVPEGEDSEYCRKIAENEIAALTKDSGELNIVWKVYSGKEKFYFLNSNTEDHIDGLESVTNPFVIYQANGDVALNGGYIEREAYNSRIIYACDEDTMRDTADKYAGQLGTYYYSVTTVEDDYEYSHSFLVRLISFISSLCILVLILDIAVIISEVKMEFRLSSMDISLKKVLGYSFFERHRSFITVNLIENIAVVILICIVTLFISGSSIPIALATGVLLTIVEFAIIFANILWVENTNISKSLKGGCL